MRANKTLPAGIAVPGYVLWCRNRRGVFSIQVTASSEETVNALSAIVLRTLQPIPSSHSRS